MSDTGEEQADKPAGPIASALGLAFLAAIPFAFWWGAAEVIGGDLLTRRGVPIHPLLITAGGLAGLAAIPVLAAKAPAPAVAGKKGVKAARLMAFAYVASLGLALLAAAWGQARHLGMM